MTKYKSGVVRRLRDKDLISPPSFVSFTSRRIEKK